MDFKFSKDADESQPQKADGEKKNQNALLVLLLILAGGFAYLYFFTGLIKPMESAKPAAPAAAPQIVKAPLPPHVGEPAKTDGKAPVKAETPKVAAPPPAVAAAPAAKATPAAPAPKPAAAPAKPAAVPATKPAPAPKAEAKKVEPAKPADKKQQPVVVANKKSEKNGAPKDDGKKAVVDVKNAATTDKKGAATKEDKKKPAASAKTEVAANAKKADSGPWTLAVGNYVLEEALSADLGRVRKAGLEPAVKPSTKKKTVMNRLLVAEFDDRAAAHKVLDKLSHHTSDAFVIEQGGKFAVYAGSYLQSESANSEKERLKAAGFTVTAKRTEIGIPSQSLTIGPFKSKSAAEAALAKLKKAGLKAALAQK
jgi:cell division protein FtsN